MWKCSHFLTLIILNLYDTFKFFFRNVKHTISNNLNSYKCFRIYFIEI